MRKLLKSDVITALSGNVFSAIIGLVIFSYLARVTSPEIFGTWVIFLSVVGLSDLARVGFIRQPIVFFITNDEKNQLKISTTGFFMGLVITFLIILLSTAALAFRHMVDIPVAQYVLWFSLVFMSSYLHQYDSWLAHAKGQYRRMNLLRLISNVLFILLLIILSQYRSIEFSTIALLYFIANGSTSVYSLVCRWKLITKISLFSLSQARRILGFGKNSFATLAGSNLLKSSDQLLIGAFLGVEASALFAIPLKILEIVDIPVRALVMTSYPKLSRFYNQNKQAEFQKEFNKISTILIGGAIPAVLALLTFPSLAIHILGGSKYMDVTLLVRVFSFMILLSPIEKILGVCFDATGRPGVNARKVWIMLLVNLIGDLVVLYYFQSLQMVVLVTGLNLLTGLIISYLELDYIKFNPFTAMKDSYIELTEGMATKKAISSTKTSRR